MQLDIPDADKELLCKWLLGTNEQTDRILDELERERPALERDVLTRRIAEATKLEERSIRDLIKGFFSISNAVATFDPATKQHAVEILFNSIVEGPASEADRTLFEARITRILKTKSIEITGKALSVMLDNPNTFHSARTLSEMRPVFTEDGLEPEAAVIVHQLKIMFVSGPEHRFNELFFALDRADLESLQQVVERAIQKHAKLAQQAQQLNLPLLEGTSGG